MKNFLHFALLPLLALAFVLALPLDAQAQEKKKKPNPVLAPIEDDPDLPRVLIIGDSISIGYTLDTRAMLKGKANLHRPPTNCGPTTKGLAEIDVWLGEDKWDVIHFNWGLHDLKYMNEKGQLVGVDQGKQQVPIKEYAKNLDELVKRLKKTGATLIWRNTTPVPEGAKGRLPADAVKYNAAAAEVMAEHEVQVHDLYSFAKKHEEDIQRKRDVHYTGEGSKKLAEEVVKVILIALAGQEVEKAAADDLPKVLIIGDSISQGYHKPVVAQLKGKADVSRIPGNGQWTGHGIEKIDDWLGETDWDVIHFNWGLWDMYGWRYKDEDRSPKAYEARLEKLVTRLKKTGAKLIWATTTPACPAPEVTMLKQFKAEVVISEALEQQYLDAAERVMKRHDIKINDLHALVLPKLDQVSPKPDNVHFTGKGSQLLGDQVAKSISAALQE